VTTNNMGTPGHPESVSHWVNKAMYWQKLEQFRKLQKGYWLVFDKCCGRCEGGWFVDNILKDVTAVEQECDFGPYRPDIVLRRGDQPARIIEIVNTSKPSRKKIDYFKSRGVDIYEISGDVHPIDGSFTNVHIAPLNCRKPQRDRINSLLDHIMQLDDSRIGIREDFRSEERKNREWREKEEEWERIRQGVVNENLRCSRCGDGFEHGEDHFSFGQTWKHKSADGNCGLVPFCEKCGFEVRGGPKREFPDDAEEWGVNGECSSCTSYLSREFPALNGPPAPSLQMNDERFSRIVRPPKERTQQYIVGERTVTKAELQAVLMRFREGLERAAKEINVENHRKVNSMSEQIGDILRAVLFPNEIQDWDWLKGVGESYLPEFMDTGSLQGDKFIYPKRWGGSLK